MQGFVCIRKYYKQHICGCAIVGFKHQKNDELIIEKGIFLGNKNKIVDNENIYISGMTNNENQTIEWCFEKIS